MISSFYLFLRLSSFISTSNFEISSGPEAPELFRDEIILTFSFPTFSYLFYTVNETNKYVLFVENSMNRIFSF